MTDSNSRQYEPRCQVHTRKGTPCLNKARFIYRPTAGGIEYLCGRHVGPMWPQSGNLREIERG